MSDPTPGKRRRWQRVAIGLAIFVACGYSFSYLRGLLFHRGRGVLIDETRPIADVLFDPVAAPPPLPAPEPGPARNVILVIADGMGFSQVAAGRLLEKGRDARLSFERLPVTGWHHPFTRGGVYTDSAASASAIATGRFVDYGAVSLDADGRPIPTVMERAADAGWTTGIVTDSYVWDATPAAFAAHASDRDDVDRILSGFADSKLDLLLGEMEDVRPRSSEWSRQVALLGKRFAVGQTFEEVERLAEGERPLGGVFPEHAIEDLDSRPNLVQLTRVALERLERSGEPFFLLVESEEADSASHAHDLDRLRRGMAALDATVAELIDFAARDGSTLLVVTADHETAGLALLLGDRTNRTLRARWATRDHSLEPVPIYAYGPGSAPFGGVHENRDLAGLLARAMGLAE